ncbi:MAG: HIT family protein [Candidatus Gracilibacteria bacterium]|nr:HIT family protein [Candidatus Gracilibacteria bacterium]
MSCIFCDIVNKKAPSWTVYQDDHVTAFFDYFPASKGHILIVPNNHYPNLFEIPEDLLAKVIGLSKNIAIFYKEKMGIEDINIVQSNGEIAGQEVFHYHMHLVPRHKGDKVNLKWIPDESIRDEYDNLKNYICSGLDN